MEQQIIVLNARPWSMKDESGSQRSGIVVFYISNEDLKPAYDTTSNEYGYPVLKQSIRSDLLSKFTHVPGVYMGSFVQRGRSGQNVLVLNDIDFLSDI